MTDTIPYPKERDVAILLQENKSKILELKERVSTILPEPDNNGDITDGIWLKYDDIFFLRYILSFNNIVDQEDAVRKTIAYRSNPENRDMIEKIYNGSWSSGYLSKTLEKYQVADELPLAQINGGFTILIRGGMSKKFGDL